MFKLVKSIDFKHLKRNDLKKTKNSISICKHKKKQNLFKKIFCPRTYKKEKKLDNFLINEYYSKFNYENHSLNQKLLLLQQQKIACKNFVDENMFKKQQQQNPYSYESKFSYDNYTYLPSPSSTNQKQHYVTPGINTSYRNIVDSSLFNKSATPHNQTMDRSIFSNTNYINNSEIEVENLSNKSSIELDVKIKELLFKLKLLYPKSIYLTQILMVESVYNIKRNNIKIEMNECLKQFEVDDRTINKKKPKRSRSITNNLAQSFCACSKLSHCSRKPAGSSQRMASNEFLSNNLMVTLPLSSASMNNLNEIIQHKNYFKLERENLELKFENVMCTLQNEILQKIKDLQMQIRFEQRLLNIEKTKMVEQQKQQHYQANCKQILHDSSVYVNETPIERKIRKRRICSRDNYTKNSNAFNPINTNNQQLNAIKFYRNINVTETSV
jgi:hypothetical protein